MRRGEQCAETSVSACGHLVQELHKIMNKISKLLITAAFAVAMVALGSAQAAGPKGGSQGGGKPGAQGQGRGPGQGGGGMRRGMNMFGPEAEKRLKITPDQKKKLEAASKEMQAAFQKQLAGKDFRSMTEADRKAMQTKMKPIGDKYQAAVKKILTPTQQKELEKMRAERMKEFGNGRGRPGGPGGPGATGGTAKAGKGGGTGKAKVGGGGL